MHFVICFGEMHAWYSPLMSESTSQLHSMRQLRYFFCIPLGNIKVPQWYSTGAPNPSFLTMSGLDDLRITCALQSVFNWPFLPVTPHCFPKHLSGACCTDAWVLGWPRAPKRKPNAVKWASLSKIADAQYFVERRLKAISLEEPLCVILRADPLRALSCALLWRVRALMVLLLGLRWFLMYIIPMSYPKSSCTIDVKMADNR